MKDPKFEEMTMSKIDSELNASEVVVNGGNKENTSLIINNNQMKYVEVPITNSVGNLGTSANHQLDA